MKVKKIRLNEAGDFASQQQVNDWSDYALDLKEKHGITTYAYTCRADLDFTDCNFIVNASRPDIKGATRRFYVMEPEEFDSYRPKKGEWKCPGDCNRCSVCSSWGFRGVVYCRRH